MKTTSVSIIEDDSQPLATFLAANGYAVNVACSSISDFLVSVQIDNPPDVVLMDVIVGQVNTLLHIPKIKAIAPNVRIVITATQTDPKFFFQALEAGVTGYCFKEADYTHLDEAIQICLAGEAYLSPPAAKMLIEKYLSGQNPDAEYNKYAEAAALYTLKKREIEVLDGLVSEKSYQQIADEIHVSLNTVRHYVVSLYKKMGVGKKEELLRKLKSL